MTTQGKSEAKKTAPRRKRQTAKAKIGTITGGLRLHLIIAELAQETAAVGVRFDEDEWAYFFTPDVSGQEAALVATAARDGGIDMMELLASTWRRVQLPDRKRWRAVP